LSTGLPEDQTQTGGDEPDLGSTGLDRRSLIKKAGIAGAAAWVAPMVIGGMISPASAASLPPGLYQLRLSSGRCDPTPVLDPNVTGACLPPDWASATLQITTDAQLASLGITVSNCRPRYAIEVDSSNPNVTFTGGNACLPANQGGGPYPGVVAGDGSSVTWTAEKAADRDGYYITVNVA
jgi:hypothetical protein